MNIRIPETSEQNILFFKESDVIIVPLMDPGKQMVFVGARSFLEWARKSKESSAEKETKSLSQLVSQKMKGLDIKKV